MDKTCILMASGREGSLNTEEDEKNKEFIELIDTRFPKNIIIDLLEAFIVRDDDVIYSLITENATPSTSFEYILGIVWYNLSGRQGRY